MVLMPEVSWAQQKKGAAPKKEDDFGLDLTEELDKPKPADEPSLAPPKSESPSASATPPASAALPPPEMSESQIIQQDRVKSIQRKVYLKRNRFELAPFITLSVNDPYYVKFGGTLRAAYYLADTLAVSVRGTYWQTVPTDDVRTAKRTFQSRIFFSEPIWMALADIEWSPLYGKVAVGNSILHLDGYLLAGLGTVVTDASTKLGRPAADMGIGLRFVVKDYLAINVAAINTTYVDTPAGTTKGATQNMFTLNAGVSIFFPFRSTGREAE
jgi:outer membrane beta-barrel protein